MNKKDKKCTLKPRCTLAPDGRSGRTTQYMRFARCTSLSHILLRFTTQNIAYTETLCEINFLSYWNFDV